MSDNDQIPTDGAYRGVPLHADQSEQRLAVVRRDIDDVHALQELDELVSFADDVGRAPEARLYARAKALAILDEAVDRRAPRSRKTVLSRERIRASASGCNSLHWQSRINYGSNLDVRQAPGKPDRRVRREVPLPEKVYKPYFGARET